MRRALGTAVFSGMLGVTLFGIVLTPVFFFVIEHLAEWDWLHQPWLQAAGKRSLAILRLEPLRHGASSLWNRWTALPPQRPPPRKPPADDSSEPPQDPPPASH
jgi:multidrug efflux pump